MQDPEPWRAELNVQQATQNTVTQHTGPCQDLLQHLHVLLARIDAELCPQRSRDRRHNPLEQQGVPFFRGVDTAPCLKVGWDALRHMPSTQHAPPLSTRLAHNGCHSRLTEREPWQHKYVHRHIGARRPCLNSAFEFGKKKLIKHIVQHERRQEIAPGLDKRHGWRCIIHVPCIDEGLTSRRHPDVPHDTFVRGHGPLCLRACGEKNGYPQRQLASPSMGLS